MPRLWHVEPKMGIVRQVENTSVVLLRATLEVVLKEHFKPFKKGTLEDVIKSINVPLPSGVRVEHLHALRLEANKLLHEGSAVMPAMAHTTDQAKEINVAGFLVTVRALIEAVK